MAKISLKKDYTDGNVLYSKDLNPNFETIETTINDNDAKQSETNASVNETLTQLSSDVSQARTDINTLQENVTTLSTSIPNGDSTTLESAKSYTDTKLQDYAKTTDIPTKISELENDDNTVKDADYVHTDNNFSDTDKSKLDSLNNYELPIASASILGGIKLGEGLTSEADGTVNVTGGGGSGENGATFTPDVSDDGTLSWTNDKGLPNPDPVNIKGPKGDTGDTGPQGEPGTIGPQGETGLQGAAGEDYLGYYSSINYTQTPSVGSTVTFQLENFSRTPVVGDNFVVVAKQANRSYLINYKVNSVDVSDGECVAAVSAFVETTGVQGFQGPAGPAGQDGADGANGQGVPIGGTIGQVLSKLSNTDFDTAWKDIESGGSLEGFYVLKPTAENHIDLATLWEPGIYYCIGAKTINTDYFENKLSGSLGFGNFITLIFESNQAAENSPYRLRVEIASNSYSSFQIYTGYNSPNGQHYNTGSLSDIVPSTTLSNTSKTDTVPALSSVGKLAASIGLLDNYNTVPLSSLNTTDKSSLVAAINELKARIDDLETPI